MAGSVNDSRPISRVMALGIVAVVAAMGYLGWRMTHLAPSAVPVSQESAPAPEPTRDVPPPPPQAPLSGNRAAG